MPPGLAAREAAGYAGEGLRGGGAAGKDTAAPRSSSPLTAQSGTMEVAVRSFVGGECSTYPSGAAVMELAPSYSALRSRS